MAVSRRITWLALGGLLVLQTGAPARAAEAPKTPGAVAYPNNPDGTPAAEAKGGTAPKAAKPDCPNGTCADSPDAPAKAGGASAGKPAAPAAAYPDAPVDTPAAGATGGNAPKP